MSRNADPYDFAEARDAAGKASRSQADSERFIVEATRALADKERTYRMELAKKIVEVHAGGAAWTVAQDLARGDKRVADLRYERDVAHGVKEAAEQASWRCAADRKDTGRFIDWSSKVAPVDGQQPSWSGQ
jgi:hypothetical protein